MLQTMTTQLFLPRSLSGYLRKLIGAIRHPISDIRDPTSDIRDSTSDIRLPWVCQRLFMHGFCFPSSLKRDPREKLPRSCLRPSAEHVSACGRRKEAPRRTREKKLLVSRVTFNIRDSTSDIRHPRPEKDTSSLHVS